MAEIGAARSLNMEMSNQKDITTLGYKFENMEEVFERYEREV